MGGHDLETLLLIAFVAGGTWAFIELADEVVEGGTVQLDRRIMLWLRDPDDVNKPIGPGWLHEACRDITSLGGAVVQASLTLSVAGFLWLRRQRRTAVFLLIAIVSGVLLSSGLKIAFNRTRPDLVPQGARVYTKSFPSGHSTMSAITYLTLGALLAQAQSNRWIKAYLLSLAVLLTVSVGISRIYLAVHWPTDVLAGWTIGASWAAACWLVHRRVQQRSGDGGEMPKSEIPS